MWQIFSFAHNDYTSVDHVLIFASISQYEHLKFYVSIYEPQREGKTKEKKKGGGGLMRGDFMLPTSPEIIITYHGIKTEAQTNPGDSCSTTVAHGCHSVISTSDGIRPTDRPTDRPDLSWSV